MSEDKPAEASPAQTSAASEAPASPQEPAKTPEPAPTTPAVKPAAPAGAPKAAPAAAKPAPAAKAPPAAAKPAPAAKAPPPPSPPPAEMIGKPIKTFVQRHVDTGEPVTIENKRDRFTGRIFRTMIDEGWIAMEHVDGRRRAFYLIEGGTLSSRDGESVELPSLSGK